MNESREHHEKANKEDLGSLGYEMGRLRGQMDRISNNILEQDERMLTHWTLIYDDNRTMTIFKVLVIVVVAVVQGYFITVFYNMGQYRKLPLGARSAF